MEYRRFDNKIVARIDSGEDIVDSLEHICVEEGVWTAQVTAIGAISQFTVSVFRTASKKYVSTDYTGNYEIVSLMGNVTTMSNRFYSHLHMSAVAKDGAMVGGHLVKAVVSATAEMIIDIIDGKVERKRNPVVGTNIMKF